MEQVIVITNGSDDLLPVASTTDPGKILNSDDYAVFENVPVFVEHQRALKNGRLLQFGKNELQLVANRSNRRIEETGDFAPVVIGHTSSDNPNVKPPKIGWAGPFRLGWLTPAKDKYAILADFRIEKDKVGLLKEYPRRSAEIWAEENYEDMYLDPISLLGADTPWSDMGVLYAKDGSGTEKVYYSIAPQAPSAYNGLPGAVKVAKTAKKEKYSMDQNSLSSDQQTIVQTIVSAILEAPEFKFLRRQMKNEAANEVEEQTPALGGIGPEKAEPLGQAQPLENVDEEPAPTPDVPDNAIPDESSLQKEEPAAPEKYEADEGGAVGESEPTQYSADDDLDEQDEIPQDAPDDSGISLDDVDDGDGAGLDGDLSLVDEPFSDEPDESDDSDLLGDELGDEYDAEHNEDLDDSLLDDDNSDLGEPSLDEDGDDLSDDLDGELDNSLDDEYDDLEDNEFNDDVSDFGDEDQYEGDDMARNEITALRNEIRSMRNEIQKLKSAYDWTTNKVVSQERYAKIADLRRQYVFDEQDFREKCRYNKMKNAEFEARCREIAATHRQVPSRIGLPAGLIQNAPSDFAERPGAIQYSKERGEDLENEVMRLSDMYSAKGVSKSSDELREEARKNCGGRGC